MDETVKNKDADKGKVDRDGVDQTESDLEVGLKETFPASDPVSATRRPERDGSKPETAKD